MIKTDASKLQNATLRIYKYVFVMTKKNWMKVLNGVSIELQCFDYRARVGRLAQGKQPTFGDTSQESTTGGQVTMGIREFLVIVCPSWHQPVVDQGRDTRIW